MAFVESRMNVDEDIKNALEVADLAQAFQAMSPSHQSEYLTWIGDAKKDTTRAGRINKMVEMIRNKQSASAKA